jgi:hypothetical protein
MCGFLLALIQQEHFMGFICISPMFIAKSVIVRIGFTLPQFKRNRVAHQALNVKTSEKF